MLADYQAAVLQNANILAYYTFDSDGADRTGRHRGAVTNAQFLSFSNATAHLKAYLKSLPNFPTRFYRVVGP